MRFDNFQNIFNIPEGEPGHVAPRQDVQENGSWLFGILLFLMLSGGCKTKEEKLECLNEEISKQSNDDYLKIAITDSINEWTQQGLRNTKGFHPSMSKWLVDAILHNEDTSRAFGWILRVSKENLDDLPESGDRDDILDYIIFFSGEIRDNRWYFYIHNMPRIWFSRKENNGEPYSFGYLSKAAKNEVVNGGYFKKCTCTVNYDYINDWIDREDRNMYEWHQNFLKSADE